MSISFETLALAKAYADAAAAAAIAEYEGVGGVDYKVVEQLPLTGKKGIIYLIQSQDGGEGDLYDEYIWVNGAFERLPHKAPKIPTKVSELQNDSGYLTSADLPDGDSTSY